MEYYSAMKSVKKKKLLTCTTTWLDLKIIMLSKSRPKRYIV